MNATSLATILTIGLPTLSVLIGILLNRDAVSSLRGDIGRVDARIALHETSLRGEIGTLRAEIVSLRASFHSDVLMLLERDSKLETRVARLERVS